MGTKVAVILNVITRCKINKQTNGDSFLNKYRQTHSQRDNRLKKTLTIHAIMMNKSLQF